MTPWPFSRNKNMTEPNVMGFLHNPVRAGANNAAEASTLQDFGFWDMEKWMPTPVAEALLSKKITWQECALLQISKRSVFNGETAIKPLVLVVKVLDQLLSLGVDELWVRDCQDYLYYITSYAQVDDILLNRICEAHAQQRADKLRLSGDYIDIWFNAFCETGLFIKTRAGLKIASGENVRAIISYIAQYGERMSISPVKVRGNEAKAFYDYMGSLTTGIVEILPPLFCVKQIPGLVKFAVAHLQQGEEWCHGLLRVGDHFVGKDGGEFTVVEVLPRVYRIRVDESGKIRTVPKTVVKSWQDFYLTHPTVDYDLKKSGGGVEHKTNVPIRDAATRPIRDLINETTIDDKYEHGYDGMLGTIARWLLDNPREEIPDSEQPKLHELLQESSNVDRLTIALKLFQEARNAPTSTSVRCWVFSPGEQACRWDEMRDGGVMALSYSECGRDLREYADEEAIRAEFKSSVEDDASHKNDVRALTDFLNVMKPGDIVFAKKGTKTFLGVGRVTGEYEFAADAPDYKHRRAVEWLKVETVEREDAVARKTLTDVTRYGDLVRELCESYGIEVESKYDEYAQKTRAMFSDVDGAKLNSIDWSEFCSTHFSGSQVSAHFRSYDSASKTALGDWLKGARENAQDIVHEFDRAPKLEGLKSFGTTICMFLMKANPKSFCSFAEQGFKSLVFLGLETEKTFPEVSVESYYHNKELQTQVLTAMAKLGIKNEADGAADYLTVNEFLWFVSENEDLIKEKVMSKQMKNVEKKPREGKRSIADAVKGDELMKRLMAALRTKPFAILAGHSGTGKSRLVRRLAYMTCNDETLLAEAKDSNAPGNYCMVQVKPNWHDSSDLIGYYSELGNGGYHNTPFVEFVCKAYAYPNTPFFVCLDEMNLAPVEHYFAEYLSAIESASNKDGVYLTDPLIPNTYDTNEIRGKCNFTESDNWLKAHGLTIPKNLFVVGTVNMDETTQQFSRKVLDRAMTILMDKVDFSTMTDAKDPCDEELLDADGIKFFLDGPTKVSVTDTDLLDRLNVALNNTPFVIAYRFAKEFALYKAAIEELGEDKGKSAATAIDHMVLMKLLPRIHGEREKVAKVFNGGDNKVGLKDIVKDGLSDKQMDSILARKDEYLTFWP